MPQSCIGLNLERINISHSRFWKVDLFPDIRSGQQMFDML